MVYDDFDEIVLSMLEKNFSLTRLQKLLEENSFLSFFDTCIFLFYICWYLW